MDNLIKELRKAKKRDYEKQYKSRPEIKAKISETNKKYYLKPEIKTKKIDYDRKYRSTPEIKAKISETRKIKYIIKKLKSKSKGKMSLGYILN
jgi:hypothetical protein